MARLSLKEQGGKIIIKRKLGWGENFNEREIQILLGNNISGLARPELKGKKMIYSMPNCILLNRYLAKGISKNDFYRVVLQCMDIVKRIETNGLNINNIIFNQQYIGLDMITNVVLFVYQPVINMEVSASIYSFLNDIAYSAKGSDENDNKAIAGFREFLKNMGGYSANRIEEYIKKELAPKAPKSGYQPIMNSFDLYADDDDDEGTFGGFGYKSFEIPETEQINNDSPDTMSFDSMSAYFQYESGDNKPDTEADSRNYEEYEDAGETVVLDNETVLLNMAPSVTYPYLIRISKNEKIELKKSSFMIGRDNRFVDYWVNDNRAVSGCHAEIFVHGPNYYIKDNNSTNKTFINNIKIDPQVPVQLENNDSIMLGDEMFEFHR